MSAAAFFGGLCAFVLVTVYSAVLNGWALSILWAWFVVTTFGAPPIGIASAIGLSLVVSYLTHQHQRSKKEDGTFAEALASGFAWSTFKPLFALLVGWIVKGFM